MYKLNMEQNQSQVAALAGAHQEQWQAARNEFASQGEAIAQTEDVAALVQKWVWIQHEQEFREYQRELEEKTGGIHSLTAMIGDLILQEKEQSWMINQRYTMEQVNEIIGKLRLRVKEVLQNGKNLNPQTDGIAEQAQNKYDSKQAVEPQPDQNNVSPDKEAFSGNLSLFPEIKPKGRIYKLQEMHTSFHLLKETEEEYRVQSPSMLALERGAQSMARESLFNNKYLRQTFKWLSKQGYNSKGLFEDISKEGDKMTLNKWMVFCKEFNFTDKLPKKDLISIFQTATKFASQMSLQDFLSAVALLQDKYVNRFHKGERNFVADVLQIDSEAAFKVKMDNLKVNYSGPRKNFFENVTYLEHERADELQRQKQFQVKKREREIVLIKGMFEDHLKDEVRQLKANREKLKATRLGSSLNMIEIKEKSKEKEVSYKTSRLQDLNYSKLFQINRGMANESNTTTANTHMYKTELAKVTPKPNKIEHKRIDADNKKNEGQQKKIDPKPVHTRIHQIPEKPTQPIPQQNPKQITGEAFQQSSWLTNIRSDTQESDDILKEHLEFEKRVKETKVEVLMREMREKSHQVEKIKQKIQKQEAEEDGDMVETQVNFNKKIF